MRISVFSRGFRTHNSKLLQWGSSWSQCTSPSSPISASSRSALWGPNNMILLDSLRTSSTIQLTWRCSSRKGGIWKSRVLVASTPSREPATLTTPIYPRVWLAQLIVLVRNTGRIKPKSQKVPWHVNFKLHLNQWKKKKNQYCLNEKDKAYWEINIVFPSV